MSPARAIPSIPLALLLTTGLLVGCGSSGVDIEPDTRARSRGYSEKGDASWYGEPFHGRRTANGEVYDMNKISAAHKKLTFGTHVRVDNLANGSSLVVRINDRGPFVKGRIIDVSLGAAKKLGMVEAGVVPVRLTVVRAPEAATTSDGRRRSSTRYRVQVGAFRDRHNAEVLITELRPRHPNLKIRSDDRWHRVQLENLKDEDKARQLVRDLKRAGYDAFLAACDSDC